MSSITYSFGNGGEYYTPRPLIKTIIKVVAPKIGETIYDGAVGSAGFLVEAFEYLKQGKLSTKDMETLQKKTFYGKEKKSLTYIIGVMNMILHGIEAPNIIHTNTLRHPKVFCGVLCNVFSNFLKKRGEFSRRGSIQQNGKLLINR